MLKYEETEENLAARSFIFCILRQYCLCGQIRHDEMG
jgi:hypothetical protein